MDTNSLLLIVLIVIVGFLAILTAAVLVIQLRNKPNTSNADVSTPLQNLTQAIQDIRVQTASLTADLKARSEVERQTADSIRRLETIVAGSSPKGAAGERVVDELFSKLPTEWQARNFRVANKTVEFGLRLPLPNNKILPIDSKWTATTLLEKFSNSTESDEQKKLRDQIKK